MSDSRPLATIILPAFDEEEALPSVLADIAAHVGIPHEVIVVDDASRDGTAAVAAGLGAKVISHRTNRGKGAAMVTGAEAAASESLVFMDADGTYPAEAIEPLVGLLADFDIARGSRTIDDSNTPRLNRVGNRMFDRMLSAFHGLDGTDHLSGLYAIRRDVFLDMKIESRGFDVEVEIGIKSRIKSHSVASLPIDYRPRIGDKKLKPLADGFRILTRMGGMLLLFSPVATFVVPGVLLTMVGLVLAVALWNGPVAIASLGLSFHSFIIAALGLVGGIQLVIIGTAGSLYRSEAGYPAPEWLAGLSRRSVRAGLALGGLAMTAIGVIGTAGRVLGWVAAGGGEFTATVPLVGFATLALVGLELTSAGLFFSMFAGRLRD
jgi:Glycosyl transferase family 2